MSAIPAMDNAEVRGRVSDEEWELRVDLAAAYRLAAAFGWDDLIFTHMSARVPGTDHPFLVNPFGLLFEEVTASNLVKVDLGGNKVMDSPYPVNPAGFTIHSAVHAARDDALCVMHLHTNEGVAVSVMERGLEPLSQTALLPISDLGYHDYEGIALEEDEKPRLVADLGAHAFLILRNHGTLTVGGSVGEAFFRMYALQRACEIQVLARAGGNSLLHVPEPIRRGITAQAGQVLLGQGAALAWPALVRKADRIDPGFRD